ncbi:MAG: hypothetical protein ABIH76_00520 [Candidatus Bathyarchaeota archaeon]
MAMNFGDKPALLEVYASEASAGDCIHYEFLTEDQKAKLKPMSVKNAVHFVLEHCVVDNALVETYKRNIRGEMQKHDYALEIIDLEELLSLKQDPTTGTVLVDERDNDICEPRYWTPAEDAEGNELYLCQVRTRGAPKPLGGIEDRLSN